MSVLLGGEFITRAYLDAKIAVRACAEIVDLRISLTVEIQNRSGADAYAAAAAMAKMVIYDLSQYTKRPRKIAVCRWRPGGFFHKWAFLAEAEYRFAAAHR